MFCMLEAKRTSKHPHSKIRHKLLQSSSSRSERGDIYLDWCLTTAENKNRIIIISTVRCMTEHLAEFTQTKYMRTNPINPIYAQSVRRENNEKANYLQFIIASQTQYVCVKFALVW